MTAKTITWVCKDCKMPFRSRELAAKHTREAHNREPKPDVGFDALADLMDFFKGFGR